MDKTDRQLVLDTMVETIISMHDGRPLIIEHNERLYKVVGSFSKDGCVWLEVYGFPVEEYDHLAATLGQGKE